jgi:PiT family inorganic phosphate transporter
MGAGVSNGGLGVFNWDAIRKVLMGLFISSAAGFALGYLAAKLLEAVCRRMSRRRTEGFFSTGQLASAALMAFAHGAQDGQKLMGVFCLTLTVGGICSRGSDGTMAIPAWVMLVCSLLMAFGTSVGGFRIIKSLGIDMVRLEKYQGFAAEIAASGSLIVSTYFGIPLSTTNTKATAMLGAGATRGYRRINWSIARDMLLAWVLTIPACLILGYVSAELFRLVF